MTTTISPQTQQILDAVNRAYYDGEARINEHLELGERADSVADFLRIEIIDVTRGEADPQEAAADAIASALIQLRECLAVVEDVNGLETAEEILATLNAVYEDGELDLHEDLERGERGDTLADFLHFEIKDVSRGEDEPLPRVWDALNTTIGELEMVLETIQALELVEDLEPAPCPAF
ncbi:hypothetical protein [Geopseudomonas aromaticivorans]